MRVIKACKSDKIAILVSKFMLNSNILIISRSRVRLYTRPIVNVTISCDTKATSSKVTFSVLIKSEGELSSILIRWVENVWLKFIVDNELVYFVRWIFEKLLDRAITILTGFVAPIRHFNREQESELVECFPINFTEKLEFKYLCSCIASFLVFCG